MSCENCPLTIVMFVGSLSRNLLERWCDYNIHTSRRGRLVSRVEFHDGSNKVGDVRLVHVPMVVCVFGEIIRHTNVSCERRLRRPDLSREDGVRVRDFNSLPTVSEKRSRDRNRRRFEWNRLPCRWLWSRIHRRRRSNSQRSEIVAKLLRKASN